MASNGVVVAKYDCDAYGAVRGQEGQRSNSFKYVAQIGHPTDEETGLIYMRARYYDPEVGRFVSEDSKRDGIQWYWYANGNPINLLDITGGGVVGLGFALWKACHACRSYLALCEFIMAALNAIDPLEVEEAWSRFMEVWGEFVGPLEGALGAASYLADIIMMPIEASLYLYTRHPWYLVEFAASVLAIGITAGAVAVQLYTLAYGYQFRIASWIALLEE